MARLFDENGNDIMNGNNEPYCQGYTPRKKNVPLRSSDVEAIHALVRDGKDVFAWLVGAAIQEIMVRSVDEMDPVEMTHMRINTPLLFPISMHSIPII